MKHHRILYRALSALLCLGLCAQLTACGKKPVPKPGSSGPSAPSVSKKVYDDSLITEVYDEEDSFTDEYGTEYSYICHVPQLEADTPEAKAINWEIMESFGNDVQATLDAAESGETPNSQYMEVTWQSYWNDSLLSLSIRVLGWTSDLIDYAVYHYDFETGQRPDNLELLDRFHVDEGDFIAALRRGAARQFDSHYAPWGPGGLSPEDENYGGIAIDLAALRAWTVAEENFSLNLSRFCPNGDGTFTAFQPVASIAGGSGWYYEPVLVEPGPGDWADGGPQSQDAFVSAWLTDDGVSVSFSKSQSRDFPDSETYRRSYGFAYDTEYPVAGCYGDYQDIFVGASGQDFCPYVFLLTKDGTVEYIDIFGGLWHGCLCSGGPLYGFRDVVGFESGVYEDGFGGGYETVYAVDKNGRKYDMPACITAQGNAIPSYAAGKWCANVYHSVASGASYEGVYYLSIHENGLVEINDVIVSIDAPLQIAGYCTYLGTTELGMVYQFGLYSGDQLREGTFALDLYNTDYGEMTITPISGVNLFDAPEGGCTVFTRL